MSLWAFIVNLFTRKPADPIMPSISKTRPAADGWLFTVEIEGDDLVVRDTTATWFGGNSDPLDDGSTASGVSTKDNLGVLGCALPVVKRDAKGKLFEPTCTSPLAFDKRIPWKTPVEVTVGNRTITVPLIDNGPAQSAGDGIDLTIGAFTFFEKKLSAGVIKGVSYRILGAAKYMRAAA